MSAPVIGERLTVSSRGNSPSASLSVFVYDERAVDLVERTLPLRRLYSFPGCRSGKLGFIGMICIGARKSQN